MFCPKCGTETPDDSQFCRKCGQGLAVSAPSSGVGIGGGAAVAPARAPEPKPRAFAMIVAVGGLIVLLVASWFVNDLRQKRTTPNSPIESIQSSTPPLLARPPEESSSTPSVPRSLSPQEIYKSDTPGMILIETYDDEGHKRGLGSGFIVASDGTAITNYHVIRGASRATVKFADGTVGSVEGVKSYDRTRDLAVVQVTPAPRTVLEIGDSDKMKVGDTVVAVGSPLGLQNTMSEGIVSGLRNGVIQISAPISPGSSGGAVFDEYGKVIGVSAAQMVAGQNLNFAIPINWAKPYLNGQTSKSLTDVAAENTVSTNVLNGSMTVPPRQVRSWNIPINQSQGNAELDGQISSVGGAGGKITLMLSYQGRPIFSCRERACEIHQSIASPGIYNLIIDNRISPIFAREVTGQISVKYVK